MITIATRRSPLAIWQAKYVQSALQAAHPGLEVQFLELMTQGDKILDTPLAKVGGKGLFVKELEQALLDKRADIAVHSMKDVPMDFPPGLALSVICERGNEQDAFISNQFGSVADLPEGAVVGTSSLRRQCQLKALRPDLQIIDLRGNVATRLGKLDQGHYAAIILAAAGLIRLGMPERIASLLTTQDSLPAVGQGAVGVECRADDAKVHALLAPLNHPQTALRVKTERAMNHRLQGGCQVPIAGYAELEADKISLRGLVGQPDGSRIIRAAAQGHADKPEELGHEVADDLLAQGAGKILASIYKAT